MWCTSELQCVRCWHNINTEIIIRRRTCTIRLSEKRGPIKYQGRRDNVTHQEVRFEDHFAFHKFLIISNLNSGWCELRVNDYWLNSIWIVWQQMSGHGSIVYTWDISNPAGILHSLEYYSKYLHHVTCRNEYCRTENICIINVLHFTVQKQVSVWISHGALSWRYC